jgi:hypothetical protein
MKTIFITSSALAISLCVHSSALAQPAGDGPPQLGESVAIGEADNTGTIKGTERFLRRNRGGQSFVGSDLRERRGFVGRQQARETAQIRSAITTTPVPPRPDVNLQLLQRRGRTPGMIYRPRLVVDIVPSTSIDATTGVAITDDLDLVIARGMGESVQSRLEGQTVVLEGTVGSSHARALAEQIARLAPMVWDVRNELVVADVAQSPGSPVGPDVEPTPTPTAAD